MAGTSLHLPPVRGEYREDADLARTTWFRVGGKADVLFRPADMEDLAAFLKNKPENVPVTVLGVGSNILVRDGGIRGVVIRLGRHFAGIEAEGDTITAGAAALDVNVAQAAQTRGIGGLEFLCGVPGTIGGALRMNAGAYGRDISEVFVEGEAVDMDGNIHRLTTADMGFSYRHAAVPEGWIFTCAVLRGTRDDPAATLARMREIQRRREDTQPVRTRTGGSTFTNPDPALSGGKKAWQLIDEAGCRGLQIGGAKVSEKHCNFLENTGAATAADLEALGEEVRRRVRERIGIDLHWEIRVLGEDSARES